MPLPALPSLKSAIRILGDTFVPGSCSSHVINAAVFE